MEQYLPPSLSQGQEMIVAPTLVSFRVVRRKDLIELYNEERGAARDSAINLTILVTQSTYNCCH